MDNPYNFTYYQMSNNIIILDIYGIQIKTTDIDLLNIFLNIPENITSIIDINRFLLIQLTQRENLNINLLNVDIEQNENFINLMGYDRALKEFQKEIKNINIIIQACIFPHKNTYAVSRHRNYYEYK